MTRIEKALAALSKSPGVNMAGESDESHSASVAEPHANALQRLVERVSELELSKESETFQREMHGLRDQLEAKSDRFEQRVEKNLSACVQQLQVFSQSLESMERETTTIHDKLNAAVEELRRQLKAEMSSSSKLEEQVKSLSATISKQASSIQDMSDQIRPLHQTISSEVKRLNEMVSTLELRVQTDLGERIRLSEEAQHQKLASLDTVLGELVRKSANDDSKREETRSVFQSALYETYQRVASCEGDTYRVLEIGVQHAEAQRDRIKRLDEALQEMMGAYNPEAAWEDSEEETLAGTDEEAGELSVVRTFGADRGVD